MHIAVDIRCLMEGRHSGVQEYTIQLLHAFSRLQTPHTFTLFYNSARVVELPALPAEFATAAWRYPNKLLNAAQWAWSQPRWDTLLPADVFFVPSLRLMPLHPTTPLVTTVHDLSFERFPEFLTTQRRLWHQLMKPQQLMQRSDRLLAVSQATAQDVTNLYHIAASKVATVHSGIAAVEPQQYDSLAQQRVRQKYHLPEKYILFLGTFEPRKNIPSIVSAYSAIAATVSQDLVLAGAAGWQLGAIEQALVASPVRHRIHLPGFIAEEDKYAVYAAADLLVYPSFSEGFGFPPLEALQVGTPVVTSLNSAMPEVVGQWATLVNPYSPSELAAVMREVLRHPARVSEDIRLAIQQRYNWERTARQTLQVLESVV